MPVPNQTPVTQHTGNGVTTTFAFNFRLPNLGALRVRLGGVLQSSGFTVTGVGGNSGSVTFATAPGAGVAVRLSRTIVLERTRDYQQNGDLLADTVDLDFDDLWMAMQELALTVPTDGNVVPPTAGNAGRFLTNDGTNSFWSLLPGGGGGGGGGVGEVAITTYGADDTGASAITGALTAALLDSDNLVFPEGTYRVSESVTIPARVRFLQGAKLSIDTGVTVTFTGAIDAGLWQIFSWAGTGKVVLGQDSTLITVPQWWGASTTATAAANSTAMQAWVNASYSKVAMLPTGSYACAGFSIPPLAEGGTSQLPFTLIGQGIDGNAGTGGSSLYWDGTGHCIDLTNSVATNSDNAILIEGIHIVGAGAADPGATGTPHSGIHAVRVNNLIIRRCQVTKTRQTGIYLERCYGSNVENCTLLENGWYGIWAFKQANICRFKDIKAYRNGKVFDRLGANLYFNGGSTFESLGPVIDNCDVSYSGNAGTLYRRSNSSLTSIAVASGVATATTAAAHGRTTGDQIAIVGCNSQDQLNTLFPATITVTGSTTFTWSTPAPDGTYTDATMTIGPCSYGLLMQDMQGARIHAYAEDCMGPAMYLGPTVTASIVEGGYWQGVDFGGLVLLDDCSNIELGAMRFFGPGAKLYMGITARKHGVNLKSSVTFGNNAKLVEPTQIRLRDGAYFATSSPSVLNASGVWLHGDVVRYLTPNINSVRGYVCSAPPNTWIADGDFIDDV